MLWIRLNHLRPAKSSLDPFVIQLAIEERRLGCPLSLTRMAKWYASDQPQPLEAGVAVAADDDVVVDDDAERLCDLGDLLRDLDVGGGR